MRPRCLACVIALAALGVALGDAPPAPVSLEVNDPYEELEKAKRAYEKLGAWYQANREDNGTGTTCHVFHLGEATTAETLNRLPDPNLPYTLHVRVAIRDGWLTALSRLQHLRHVQMQSDRYLTDARLAELACMPRLERLDIITPSQITKPGWKALATSKGLRSLRLINAKVTDEDVKTLTSLPHLEHLGLYDCSAVTDASLQALTRMKRLKILNIMRCEHVTTDGLRHLAGLRQLEELELSLARPDMVMKHLARLDSLERLHISNAPVTDADLKTISGIRGARTLTLRACWKITDAGIKELTTHRRLECLRLPRCERITDVALKALSQLQELRRVDVEGCAAVTDIGLAELAGLPKLCTLDLSGTQITDAGLRGLLARRRGLEELHLFDTWVTDAVVLSLVPQKHLRVLSLAYCQGVTDASVKWLGEMRQLESLALHGSGLTAAGRDKLRALLPNCEHHP